MYIDESAQQGELYLFGGLVVDEEQCCSIARRLDGLAKKAFTDFASSWDEKGRPITNPHDVEFHAVMLMQGKEYWREVPQDYRLSLYENLLKIIKDEGGSFFINGINILRLKRMYRIPYPERDLAMAHLLGSVQKTMSEHLLGLADDHYTKNTSRLKIEAIRHYAQKGYCRKDQPLTNYIDTVFFGDSLNSRLLQAADMVTYLYCRRWNTQTAKFDHKESKEWFEKRMGKLFAMASDITKNEDPRLVFPFYPV